MMSEQCTMIVDPEKCIGIGLCELLEEAAFRLDEDTAIAMVIGSKTLPTERADVVVEKCPSGAISKQPVNADQD